MKDIRKYDKEFKLNAVKLLRDNRKSCKEIEKNLGIPASTLYGWIQEHTVNGDKGFQGSGVRKPCNEEVYKLKK